MIEPNESAQAKNVTMKDSFAAVVQAEEVTVQGGGVVAAQAGTLFLNGAAGVVVARSAEFGSSVKNKKINVIARVIYFCLTLAPRASARRAMTRSTKDVQRA